MTSLADDILALGWRPAELARQVGCTPQVADRWVKNQADAPPLVVNWVARLAQVHRDMPVPAWRRPRGIRAITCDEGLTTPL